MKRYVCQNRRKCRREDRPYAGECGFSKVPRSESASWHYREPFFCPAVGATVIIEEYAPRRARKKAR